MVMWIESKNGCRWTRSDGAVVLFHSGPPKFQWIAFEPDPSNAYLPRDNGRLSWPRRWRTAQAAMDAVDAEYPFLAPSK